MSGDLVRRFCEEGIDQLRSYSSDLLALEQEPDPRPRFNDILRGLHSLKGSSRMLGLSEIGEVLHATEDVFSLLVQNDESRSRDVIDMLLHVGDKLQESLVAIHEDDTPVGLDELLHGVRNLRSRVSDHPGNRIDALERMAPEVFQVLNGQQREMLRRNLSVYRHLFVLTLSLQRARFAEDVRAVHAYLNDTGLLIGTTGTTEPPAPEFDLCFVFLALSDLQPDEMLRRLASWAPGIHELVEDQDGVGTFLSGSAAAPVQEPVAVARPAGDAAAVEYSELSAGKTAYDDEFARLQQWFLDESEEHLKRLSSQILAFERRPDLETINSIFRSFHNLKGSGGSYRFSNISRIAHLLESFVQPFRTDIQAVSTETISRMLHGVDVLSRLLQECKQGFHERIPISDVENELKALLAPSREEKTPAGSDRLQKTDHASGRGVRAPETLRVNTNKLDSIVATAVELSISHHSGRHLLAYFAAILEQQKLMMKRWRDARDAFLFAGERTNSSSEQLEEFSLTISSAHQRLYDFGRMLETSLSTWSSLALLLSNDVVQLQLQPLSTLFDIFHRIVRDLCISLNKNVVLDIDGGDVEVDRRIIEALKDPFIHLLRNAVDHGLETPEERRAQTKAENGTIRIAARQMGFSFSVSVSDDGKGIDRDAIAAAAVERRLATDAQMRVMSDQDVFRFLFQSGFSTRRTASDISGRGVGLDIVATNVRHLGGDVTVRTERGQGTTFEIVLPTTLTLTRVLVIETGSRYFSLPVSAIERIVHLTQSMLQSFFGRRVMQFEDALIPLLEIEDMLNLPRSPRRLRNGLIIGKGEARFCLSVPRILDETECMTKPLPVHFRRNRLFSGANLLADGNVALVLAPHALFEAGEPAPDSKREKQTSRKKRILVVDDSLIARELLKNILLTSGYDVSLARDGQDGMSCLRAHAVDLVLSDLDMPVMDGLTLARCIRQEKELDPIPVVIFTSKEDPEQRAESERIGVSAYILKGAFNQHNLLATIERLVRNGHS
jgi:two-component system, chemotaxis family, sensor kinase CheA